MRTARAKLECQGVGLVGKMHVDFAAVRSLSNFGVCVDLCGWENARVR